MTKRQALKALVAAAIPWHLGWTDPPPTPGPYMIILDDVSDFIVSKNGESVVIPVNEMLKAIKPGRHGEA